MIKLKDILNEASTSESFSQMKNLMSNAIPMMFPKEEGKLQAKYYYNIMQSPVVGSFNQALLRGDTSAIKLWPKVSKVIYKNINDYYKEDIMVKKKLHSERNKLLIMMGKYGKKLSVNEGIVTEGKFKMKGKYLNMPDGEVSSIPGDRDLDDIVFSIGQKTFRLSSFGPGGKKMYVRGDYDKEFKNGNDLAKWLNKNKAKYIGIDRR
jgi:hypothetical protein